MNKKQQYKSKVFRLLLTVMYISIFGTTSLISAQKDNLGAKTNKQKLKKDSIVTIVNKFNEDEVKWFKTKGNSTIKGIAKFKSKDGEIRFGSNFRIELNASSKYAQERLHTIYKSKNSGFVFIENGVPKFKPDPKGYHDTKKTMCNEEGYFEFTNLPEGDYYVIAFMLWDKTGGGIMQRVQLSKNEVKVIEMVNFY